MQKSASKYRENTWREQQLDDTGDLGLGEAEVSDTQCGYSPVNGHSSIPEDVIVLGGLAGAAVRHLSERTSWRGGWPLLIVWQRIST